MERDEALNLLGAHREELRSYGVKTLSLFGSIARGTAVAGSDVDLLVELDGPVGLFTFVRLKRFLEGLLGRHVDLVPADAIKRQFRDRVLAEAVRAA